MSICALKVQTHFKQCTPGLQQWQIHLLLSPSYPPSDFVLHVASCFTGIAVLQASFAVLP